ncbi:MAG: amino acid ABC transporter substrate-binding protein [Lachnospiraceae bacterium]|nr:amino acid ABC transporter substrate-binding protein [Lachnospiraceae bacterium]
MKKRLYAFLLAVTTILLLTACGSKEAAQPAAEEAANEAVAETAAAAEDAVAAETVAETAADETDDLARIQEAGVILVGVEGTYPPYNYHDENDVLTGYEVEVAQAVAAKLGVTAEFVETDWDALIAGLEVGRFDVIFNDVTPTDERKEKYDFTDPYSYVHDVVVVAGSNEDIKSLEDLNGKKTSNTISSTFAQLAEQYGSEIIAVDSFEESVELVLTGRSDATINSQVVYAEYMTAHPDADLKIAAQTEEAQVSAVPVRKGQTNLLNAINGALKELREDGTLSEISLRYFGTDITQAD